MPPFLRQICKIPRTPRTGVHSGSTDDGGGDLEAELARDDRPLLLAQRVPVPDGARQRHGLGLPGGAVGEYERRFERVCRGGVVSVLQRAVEAALEVRLDARLLAERAV